MRSWVYNSRDYTVYGILQARILKWVAFPFSSGFSQPRDWTQVSHITGGIFTSWATGKAHGYTIINNTVIDISVHVSFFPITGPFILSVISSRNILSPIFTRLRYDFTPQVSLAAAAAKSHQLCPTLCDPIDGSPPGSPSLGFSRQEHWSGLPFPSPMCESEKWKWSCSVVSDS